MPEERTGTAPPVLAIRDFSVSYFSRDREVRAVQHVDLELHPGEVVGLAGESGSGKSTLALGACRLLRPPAVITSGSVIYRGRRVREGGLDMLTLTARQLRALRWREIAIVFQSAMNALNPVLRISDQLTDVFDAHLPLLRDQKQDRAAGLMDMVGIPRARLRSYPHQLSGGMRQRVMIAMALAVEPEVVIMDEPTTGLDVVVQREILQHIVELREQLGFAVLFITHDLSLLLDISHRISVMYGGQLVEVGEVSEIQRRPAHPYTVGLLNSFPSVRGPRSAVKGIPGSPPDLGNPEPGCPFIARCGFAAPECCRVDMQLLSVPGSSPGHVTACPFVLPGAAQPKQLKPAGKPGARA